MKKILFLLFFSLNLMPNMNDGNFYMAFGTIFAQQQGNEDYYDCDYGISPLPCDWDDVCVQPCNYVYPSGVPCDWSGPCNKIETHKLVGHFIDPGESSNHHEDESDNDNNQGNNNWNWTGNNNDGGSGSVYYLNPDDNGNGNDSYGNDDGAWYDPFTAYHIKNGRNAVNKIKDGLDSGDYSVYVAEIEDPSQKKVKVIDNLSKSLLFTSIVQELGAKVIDMSNDHALLKGLSTTLTTFGVGVSVAHAAVLLMKDESLTTGEIASVISDGANIVGVAFTALSTATWAPYIVGGATIISIGAGLFSMCVNEIDIPLEDGRILHIKKFAT